MYYKRFECIANACEATCCAGWEIVIDEESIDRYLNIRTEFGNRLCNSIDFQEGVFHQDKEKRCAFLNQDNLCDIYSEIGEDYLCYTCKQYPRHIEEFEDLNEVSLSISCPEVAKMILGLEEKVTFYEEDIEEEVEEYEDFDCLFYELLYEVREVMFEILQNREILMTERMKLAVRFAAEVQEKIDLYNIFEIEDVICKYEGENVTASTAIDTYQERKIDDASVRFQHMRICIQDLYRLEVLRDDWRPYLDAAQEELYRNPDEYVKEWEIFRNEVNLEQEKEQLMIYFIYSYLCGAVYDGEMKVKYLLAHTSTDIVEELWFAKWKAQNHILTTEDKYRIVYNYAREIEHSDTNLETLEEIYTGEAYEK